MSFATSNTKLSYSIDLVDTPKNYINTIPETPNLLHQYINSKESVRRIIESEKFTDTIFEIMKSENLKTDMIYSQDLTTSFLKLNTLEE